ncbi:FAD/NAD(P)-binding protein [Amycolatopsis sp. CA-230715]|uniref:FAD/NAD(P)-binding protein n=1 Tax=Amycolatopsis sp. CA-230715 TaxID=2745196 RepID=UPI001C337BD0|nr:FAD/NAD(P)-binding protein [Amycolatopsis sp. CA-230715]QWF77934.1 Anaerobic sulfite reductase subunit B [Amycolatopsis sp. CA-230715]
MLSEHLVDAAAAGAPMVPAPYRITAKEHQTADVVTLRLEPVSAAVPPFRPGQFMMLYAFGVGEIAISVSGDPANQDGALEHTVRAVGAVSRALHDAPVGAPVGVRGPFGTSWDLESAVGRDLVVVAGGVGMAPLRPVVLGALAGRERYGRLVLIAGARTPGDLLFSDERRMWSGARGLEAERTVDRPAPGWRGPVGFVTEPLARLALEPARTTAFLCGPEPMMRFCAQTLLRKGIAAADIRVSLERNMKCGAGLCGHCQLGPLLLCRDGPVIGYAVAGDLMKTKEL